MTDRPDPQRPWPPTKYLDFEETISTNMGPARVWTDAGAAFLKPMASDVNSHALAMELICTRLAEWFGLRVFDACVLYLGPSDTFPRKSPKDPDARAELCSPGPAFCTRGVTASRWDGSSDSLATIANPGDIARLVVFDTLIRNDDRFPPIDSNGVRLSRWSPNLGNVLLVRDPPRARQLVLVAMDFGRALIGEGRVPLKGFGISKDQDEGIYGLYPEFCPYLTPQLVDEAIVLLKRLDRGTLTDIVAEVPDEWELEPGARTAVVEHLYRRARYLADTIKARLAPLCYPQGLLPGY